MNARLRALTCALLCGLATSAQAGDNIDAPSPDDLVGRIGCVAWRRDYIEERFRELMTISPVDWTMSHQMLAEAGRDLDIFEANHVRPFIDAATQDVLLQTYWPAGVPVDAETYHRCAPYQDSAFLTTSRITGIAGLPEDRTDLLP